MSTQGEDVSTNDSDESRGQLQECDESVLPASEEFPWQQHTDEPEMFVSAPPDPIPEGCYP